MKTFLFIVLGLSLSPTLLMAQSIVCKGEDCGSFNTIIRDAEKAIADQKYSIAVRLYNAARVCCPAAQSEIDAAVEKTFAAIDQQRIDALKANVREKNEKNKAESAQKVAEKAQRAAEKSSKSNRLAALALKNGKTNPTLGLHLANLAWQVAYDSTLGYCTEPGVTAVMHDIISDEESWMFHPFKGHTETVNSAVFSPDGTRVLTASSDGTAMTWDRAGHPLDTLRWHKGIVNSAIYSPDGKYILTVSEDSTARVWSKDGDSLYTLKIPKTKISTAVFSPDGKTILTNNSEVRLWNAENGKFLRELEKPANNVAAKNKAAVETALFSPDGRYILTAAKDSLILLFSGEGRFLRPLKNNFTYSSIIRISPDGGRILTYDSPDAGFFVLRDTLFNPLDTIQMLGRFALAAEFSPDGSFLVFGFSRGAIQIWKEKKSILVHGDQLQYSAKVSLQLTGYGKYTKILLDEGNGQLTLFTPDGTMIRRFEAHTGYVSSSAFSRDGKEIITASIDKTARVWHKNEAAIARMYAKRTGSEFSPDEQQVLVQVQDGYGIYTKATSRVEPIQIPNAGRIFTIDYAPNGMIIAGSLDSSVLLISPEGNLLHTIKQCINSIITTPVILLSDDKGLITVGDSIRLWDYQGHWVRTFQLPGANRVITSPNGDRMLVFNSNTTQLVDYKGSILKTFYNFYRGFTPVFSSDGTLFYSMNDNFEYDLWDKNGKNLRTGNPRNNFKPVFSPDNKIFYFSTANATIGRWAINGDSMPTIGTQFPSVYGMSVSPKGNLLLYITDNGIMLTDKNGNVIQKIEGHTGDVSTLVFSPDEQHLLSFAADFSIRCWNIPQGSVSVWEGHNSALERAFFSPDGQYVISTAMGGILKIWEVKTGNQLRTLQIPPGDQIRDVWFSRDNDLIIAGSAYGQHYLLEGISLYLHNHQVLSVADLVKANAGLDAKEVLQKAATDEIIEVAAYYFDRQNFAQAQTYYEQAEQRQHRAATLINLDIIAHKNKSALPIERFLSDNQPDNLCTYGEYFYGQAKLDTARQLFERAETFAHTFRALSNLKTIAERKSEKFDDQQFLLLEQPTDIAAAGRIVRYNPVLAVQLFEKSEKIQHSVYTLLQIENIAWLNKKTFDYNRFMAFNNPNENLQYADRLYNRGHLLDAYNMYKKAEQEDATLNTLFSQYGLAQQLKIPFDKSRFLAPNDANVLLEYAQNLQELEDWEIARQIYAKAESILPSAMALTGLYITSLKTGSPFDKSRLWASKDGYQLVETAGVALQYADLETAYQLYEHAEGIQHTVDGLVGLYKMAAKTGKSFDKTRLWKDATPEELMLYGETAQNLKDWETAQQIYQKLEDSGDEANGLNGLYSVALNTAKPFEKAHLLVTDDLETLLKFGKTAQRLHDWETARKIYGKAERTKHSKEGLDGLYSASLKVGKKFDKTYLWTTYEQSELLDKGAVASKYKDWETAHKIYAKADSIESLTSDVLPKYYSAARQTNKPFKKARLWETTDPNQLLYNSNIALQNKDWETARRICQKSDSIASTPQTKAINCLLDLYEGKPNHFEALLEVDSARMLVDFADAIRPDTFMSDINLDIRDKWATQLEDKALRLDTTYRFRVALANTYNSIGFTKLLTENAARMAEKLVRRGIDIAPNYDILYTNLPPALLLQGRFDEAKIEYLKYKDRKYTGFGRWQFFTYKDAFLDDFMSIEEAGVYHPDIARMRAILDGEPDPGRQE